MLRILKISSPITIAVQSSQSLYRSDGVTPFNPTDTEMYLWSGSGVLHDMLLSGIGKDGTGTRYFETQNSHEIESGIRHYAVLSWAYVFILSCWALNHLYA
ncbi:unnamed protein product [Microthlaspi erraticum]|uniref:Uncharacterized protein n=1 Tax=Microthlaspi erraticum TaxID=1685480 RepID=A0A6D2KU95_9BRAS|nr:unnamed protein product [Microthlaspi erraticum]